MTSADAIELVIFDCDGVLVDSEVLSVAVSQRMLADIGWQLSVQEIADRFVGGTNENFVSQIEDHLGRCLDADWDGKYQSWFTEAFERELTTVAGIEDVLEQLDLPACVASNGSHEKIRSSLTLTGLIDRFDGRIFSADDVEIGKPAPDLFLHAAATMGADPRHCVVVEDSRFGVEAARAAGMRVFGYSGGLTPSSRLIGENTTVFSSMAQLSGYLQSR